VESVAAQNHTDVDQQVPPIAESDRDLICRLARGEEPAWQEFLDLYGDVIYSHIYYTLKKHNFRIPQDEIEDAVQDLFERFLADDGRKLRSFQARHGCSFSGWLRVVCVNHALGLIRRRKPSHSLDDVGEQTLHQLIDQSEITQSGSIREKIDAERLIATLESAAESLPPRDRLVFRLYYRDERTRNEIALVLKIKPNHVDQILFRIREELRDSLAENGFV
jgi:RNA polymerase sigma-70 factor (ECF subfamily)